MFKPYSLISLPQFWRWVHGMQVLLWLLPRAGPKASSSHQKYLSARWEKLTSKTRSTCTKETCHIWKGSYFSDDCRKMKSREGENKFTLMGQNQGFDSMTRDIEEYFMYFQGLLNYTYLLLQKKITKKRNAKSNQRTLSSLTRQRRWYHKSENLLSFIPEHRLVGICCRKVLKSLLEQLSNL